MILFILFIVLYISGYTEVAGEDNCHHLGINLYEDIKCRAIKKEGQECPTKYECPNFQTENGSCLFKDKLLKVGNKIDNDLILRSCNIECFCNSAHSFTCPILDCPEWLGVPVEPGCYRKYDINKCCSVGQICNNQNPAVCKFDGARILEGQKFFPHGTCKSCVCSKEFKGKYESPFCEYYSCNVQIHHSDKLRNKCAPLYRKSDADYPLCCPDSWICPSSSDKIITINGKADQSSNLTCQFGENNVKLGEGFHTTNVYYGAVTCECILPPFLTCKMV